MKNYHDILHIKQNSSESDIRDAYRKLAKQYHPDINKSPGASEKFIEATEAYEFLLAHVHDRKVHVEDHDYEDYRKTQEYDEFIRKVRESARRQSKMRYEEFKKQNEAFQKSGFNDIYLFMTILSRILMLAAFFFLIIWPAYMAFNLDDWMMIFFYLITMPFAGIIIWYVMGNRKNFFKPGNFYYTPARIKQIFTDVTPSDGKCYYCSKKRADSRPYQFDLLKLKDIKYKTYGPRQHSTNYISDRATIIIPRSRKAMIIHATITLIKVFALLFCLIFIADFSIIWRFIAGMLLGAVLSYLLLIITGTKNNVGYLLSFGSLIRIVFWIYVIYRVSDLTLDPLSISASDDIFFVVAIIFLTDCFLMGILRMILGKRAYKPIFRQYDEVQRKFEEGYKVYNEIPVISVVYPTFKWIFG